MKFIFDHVHFVCRGVKRMAEHFERVFGAERIAFVEGPENIRIELVAPLPKG